MVLNLLNTLIKVVMPWAQGLSLRMEIMILM